MGDIVFWTAFTVELIVFGLFVVSKVRMLETGSPPSASGSGSTRGFYISCA